MKKIFTFLGVTLLTFNAWSQLTSVTLSGASMITSTGGNLSLNLTSDGTILGVNWEIDDSDLASLSNQTTTGVRVDAKRNGVITITANVYDDITTVTGTHIVTISNQIESLTISGSSSFTATNSADIVNLTVLGNLDPINGSNLSWSVMPSSLAGVNSNSTRLRVAGNGVVTVTAMSKADNSIMSNSIVINLNGFVPVVSATVSGAMMLTDLRQNATLSVASSPSDATLPVVSWSSSDNCIVGVNGTTGTITAKRNGVATITATVSNSGSSTTATYVITVSGQRILHETFVGTWDGNPYTRPSTWDSRISLAALFPDNTRPSGAGFPAAGNTYMTSATGVDKLTYMIANSNTTFENDGPFWSGPNKVYINFDGADFGGNGCGLDLTQNQTVWVDVENTSSGTLTLQVSSHDQTYGGFFFSNNQIPLVVTIAGNSRMVVEQNLPSTSTSLQALGFRFADFTGTVNIHSVTVGASKTNASLTSSNEIMTYLGSSIISPVNNVVTNWQMAESSVGIATIVGLPSGNGKLMATGVGNGTVTISGTFFNSNQIGSIVVTISNQLATSIGLSASANSISERKGMVTITPTGNLPSGTNQVISSWTLDESVANISSLIGANTQMPKIMATGLGNGTVTLTGMTSNSSVKGILIITVSNQKVESISIVAANSSTGIATNGGTLNFSLKVIPSIFADSLNAPTWEANSTIIGIDENTGVVTAQGNGVVTITANINYKSISLADASGITSVTYVLTISGQITGVNSVSESSVSVSPNPTEGSIQISGVAVAKVTVLDFSGKAVATTSASTVDLSSLPNGIYLAVIETKGGSIIKRKVVKN
jgi:hypothetical protein